MSKKIVSDESGDVMLSLYEDDLGCDMECHTCSKDDRLDCVREMKEVLLVVIDKLNLLFRDFKNMEKQFGKLLGIGGIIENATKEPQEENKTEMYS